MTGHRLAALLHLARQGIEIEVEFGTHSVEALVWIARTVEESVYQPASFVREGSTLRFTLANPPLRTAAYSVCRVGVDGRAPSTSGVRWRTPPDGPWRTAASLTADDPLHFRPGGPVEFEVDDPPGDPLHPVTVRLELECVAIPPLVWMEFVDTPRLAEGTRP